MNTALLDAPSITVMDESDVVHCYHVQIDKDTGAIEPGQMLYAKCGFGPYDPALLREETPSDVRCPLCVEALR